MLRIQAIYTSMCRPGSLEAISSRFRKVPAMSFLRLIGPDFSIVTLQVTVYIFRSTKCFGFAAEHKKTTLIVS